MRLKAITVILITLILFSGLIGVCGTPIKEELIPPPPIDEPQPPHGDLWMPYVPNSEQVDLAFWMADEMVYVNATIQFGTPCYAITDWGTVTKSGYDIWVDSVIWVWWGFCIQMVPPPVSHTYEIGPLENGTYTFTFKAWGTDVESVSFTVRPTTELLLETDRDTYVLGENVTVTLTNIGTDTVSIGGYPAWGIYAYPEETLVYPMYYAFLLWELKPRENDTIIWSQYNVFTNSPVDPGMYVVRDTHGWGLSTFFEIIEEEPQYYDWITVLSPENKTYSISSVPLTFTVNKLASWTGYSLDNQANVTITGNTTLSGLSQGTHSITVYANDTAGNMGYSNTVYFTIQTHPEDTAPPNISIMSPENKTYATSDIPLTFAVDEPVSWMAYNLDGQANITIAGNTTLTGLSDGMHSPVVYASDIAGNTGSSAMVCFTIQTTPIDTTAPMADAGPNQVANVETLVTFDASGSTDDVGIVSCEWDFGDGTTDTGITCNHTYIEPGNYTVTLTAKDVAGNFDTDTIIVEVIEEVPSPFPWWTLGVTAVVVIGIAVAAAFLWRRRSQD